METEGFRTYFWREEGHATANEGGRIIRRESSD